VRQLGVEPTDISWVSPRSETIWINCSARLAFDHSISQARLNTLAQIASERAGSTFEQASQALKSIALIDLPPCSPEGIDQMRIVAMNTFSIESVGYEEDVFACTSFGPTMPRATRGRKTS